MKIKDYIILQDNLIKMRISILNDDTNFIIQYSLILTLRIQNNPI